MESIQLCSWRAAHTSHRDQQLDRMMQSCHCICNSTTFIAWNPRVPTHPLPKRGFWIFQPYTKVGSNLTAADLKKVSSRRESGHHIQPRDHILAQTFHPECRKMRWGCKDVIPTLGFPPCLQSSRGFCRILVQQLPWGRKWSVWGTWHCLEKPYFISPFFSACPTLDNPCKGSAPQFCSRKSKNWVLKKKVLKKVLKKKPPKASQEQQQWKGISEQETIHSQTHLGSGIIKPQFGTWAFFFRSSGYFS